MNGQNQYTIKASEALQDAFTSAAARGNPETTPTHLLLALMEQEAGIVPRLLANVGVPPLHLSRRAVFVRCWSRRESSPRNSRTSTSRSSIS